MPIYEYRCRECGREFEKLQKVTDEPVTTCETCGGAVDKLWSRTGFQFKGEGWYVTDYAAKKPTGNGDKNGEKTSASESTAKSETASNTAATSKSDAGSVKD